jgi:hypothetical protein
VLGTVIQGYTVPDVEGDYPYTSAGSVNSDWSSTFDLARAAAYIWQEKAASLAANYDFTADGATFHRSQAVKQAMEMSAYWNSRRMALGRVLDADLGSVTETTRWIGNLAEDDD